MALLMEPGTEPHTESEQADLAGIAAIKDAAAREYKEQGNQFVRMGRKHYAEAVDCYTKAIAQMEPVSSPDAAADASILFANRAHVNLLLGNHRRALDDAEQAVRLSPSNVKVRLPTSLLISHFGSDGGAAV
jgi:tetratricopeptide (TPR) repeat protein